MVRQTKAGLTNYSKWFVFKVDRVIAFIYLALILSFTSCVNDLETIQRVTYDPKAPDEVTKNLRVFYTDSGYAQIEITAAIAESYSKPETVTKLKDGLKVNFFSP
ncbi:MAG: hypothetical protein ACK50Y_02160, partial [Flavobacteriia bacterium]